jgi:hypothetical protein
MTYKTILLLVLRATQNTQMQCKQHAEFLNVKSGGTYNNQ